MKKQDFFKALKNRGIDKKLGLAVVKQLGYTFGDSADLLEELSITFENIASHGINCGYGGFTYYTDTNAFFAKNKAAIVAMAEQMADEIGDGNALDLVCGFNCLKGGTSQERRELAAEVARALYGRPKKDDYWNVPNALAWFAGEEVASAWSDFVYESKND